MSNTVLIVACIYCEREMASSQIYRHESVCLANPDIADAVRVCMHGCAEGPFAPSMPTYDRERALHDDNLPSGKTIMAALDVTSWEGVAAWAGFRPRSEMLAYTFEEMRRVSAQNHDGVIGPGAREWDTERPPGAYVLNRLVEMFGAWSKVLEAAGLRCESHGYYLRRTRERTRQGESVADAYITEARQQAQGADGDYPALPGKWKVKTYALWPSGQQITGMVYELR